MKQVINILLCASLMAAMASCGQKSAGKDSAGVKEDTAARKCSGVSGWMAMMRMMLSFV